MNIFIYLIVWCAIFNESKSLSTDNNGNNGIQRNDSNNVTNSLSEVFIAINKNIFVERTITPSIIERSTDRLESNKKPSDENKNHTKTRLTERGEIVNTNTEASTDYHKTTKRFSHENKHNKESKLTGSDKKIHNSLIMASISPQKIVSTNTTAPSSLPTGDPNSINLPKYGIVLITFVMALMFFIIMALLFMLYKIKQEKSHRDSMNVAIQPKNEINYKYSRQLSGETSNVSTLLKDKTKDSKLVLTRTDSKALFFNNLDTVDTTKEKSQMDDIKTSRITTPKSKFSTTNERPPTLTRILKQPSLNHVPISREQMSKLCEGVLSKTKRSNEAISLSDLDKFLYESRKEEKEKADLEKCLSTPELDSDMYDVLPTPSPRKFFNDSDDVKNELFNDEAYDNLPKHKIKQLINDTLNKNKKSNDDVTKESFDYEVYDNPPKHKIKQLINDNLNKNTKSNDETYDNPASSKHDNEVFDDGIYDKPPPNHSRKRNVVVSADHENYVLPLTKDNGLYCNAKPYADNKIINSL